ncbi:MAG: SDR family oxidoreductase [Polyangiales bacterium]
MTDELVLDAVITGASRGIGYAFAHRTLVRGGRVVLCARSEDELARSCAHLEIEHGRDRVHAVCCDVSNEDEVAVLQRESERFFSGAPSVVVNNAGIVERNAVHEMSLSQWNRVLGVNVTGAFLVTRAFLPAMRASRRGRVIFVSSISGTLGTPRASAYNASKWAMIGLMKSLAEEQREANIQAMAVLPGSVDTQMLVGSGFDPQMSADDVAKTIEFVAFDAPAAMTGSALEVFG